MKEDEYWATILNDADQFDESRPHGEWKGASQRQLVFTRICTSCNTRSAVGHFCMWCGADMRKEGENE